MNDKNIENIDNEYFNYHESNALAYLIVGYHIGKSDATEDKLLNYILDIAQDTQNLKTKYIHTLVVLMLKQWHNFKGNNT